MTRDLGKITIPERWEDMTLKQYMGLQDIITKSEDGSVNKYEVLAVLTDRSEDDILSFPIVIVDKLMSCLEYLNHHPKYQPSDSTVIDGVEYTINYMEQMTVREYNDIEMISRNDPNNIAAYMAVMLRPVTKTVEKNGKVWKENEPYTLEYSNRFFDDNYEKFLQAKITDLLPVIGFFLLKGIEYSQLSNGYIQAMKDQLEECVQLTLNSAKTTGLKRWSMMRLTRDLKRLKKSLQEI